MPHGPADHDHGPIPPGEDADLPRDEAVDGSGSAAQDGAGTGDDPDGDTAGVAGSSDGGEASAEGIETADDGVDDATWASIVAELAATPTTDEPTGDGTTGDGKTADGQATRPAPGPTVGPGATPERGDAPEGQRRRTIPGRRVIRPAGTGEQLQQADDWAAEVAANPAATGRDWAGSDQFDAAAEVVDEQDRFVPDDPGPVLTGNPLVVAGWTALILGIVTALVVGIVWRSAPDVLWQSGLLSAALGIAVLIWQMPRDREDDDNDGAVV